MQVSVESGEGLERRMTVGLEADQVEGEVDRRLRELVRTARLPGFRPGKVPVKVLRQRFGQQVRGEVLGELVQSTFAEAVGQKELRPAGAPSIDPDIDHAARRYAYTATFEVLPEFALGSLEGKVLKRPVAQVQESDVDALIERLRAQRKTFDEADRPAQEGDRVTMSFVGSIDGEPFEGGSAEHAQLELGSGRMIPGFEAGLIGARAGEERSLQLSFPEEYHAEHLKGKPVTFAVTVEAVAAPRLPEVDEAFARELGIEDGDLARFRADVRRNMERELKQRVEARIKRQAMDLLLEANPIDLPQVLIAQEIRTLKAQMQENLGGGRQLELPDGLFEEEARRRVALGLVIAEVVKANDIKVDPERVREVVEDMAATYENPQEVVEYYYSRREHLSSVETLTLENQVVDWVTAQVTVADEPHTFDELTKPAGE
jgi:trigger factor